MTSPFSFPDWVPPWAQLLVLILGTMLALCFALMPFSVFGVKSRLESVEARLDEIQGEIRSLAHRLPEPGVAPVEEPLPQPQPQRPTVRAAAAVARPPVPPSAWAPEAAPRRPIGATSQPLRGEPDSPRPRLEPRIDRSR